MKHISSQAVYAYWNEKRGARPAPERSDIDPADIRRALGDTVMLAGLISDGVERGANGIPGLSRIPVVGALFGSQRSNTSRSETIVLITTRIVRNNAEARDLTDEYSRRFRAMEPLNRATRD